MITDTVTDFTKTHGDQLYAHAKQLIPGGTQLLSKRPEMFLPDQWPSYYTKAKGCAIWDLEGRKYIDMTTMGIGACLLGYADDDVNAAVRQVVDNGNMTSLNSPAEVELAELLCQIHPWAGGVRYARSGGESLAIAVRIARAFSGLDKIAFCGYHGWSDWYLAANLSGDKSLDGHLIPGLQPNGVPRGLIGTALPFRYNKIEELQAIADQHGKELGVIVMESMRSDLPKDNFLHKVKEIARSTGAVLIFDEVTAGWRNHFGGAHLMLGVEPDIAVFAKSISNGYPMGAIIGRKDVMEAAQTSFISSTYWTEAIGPTASVVTIRKMQRIDLPSLTRRVGMQIQEGWKRLAGKHGLNITLGGNYPLSNFTLNYGDQSAALRTLLTQSMLERGYLASTAVYATSVHTSDVIEEYLAALDEVFPILKDAADKGDAVSRLRGPIVHGGFQRLT